MNKKINIIIKINLKKEVANKNNIMMIIHFVNNKINSQDRVATAMTNLLIRWKQMFSNRLPSMLNLMCQVFQI